LGGYDREEVLTLTGGRSGMEALWGSGPSGAELAEVPRGPGITRFRL